MNFFEQQDRARRRTGWLVLLFILAIVCVALSFYGVALFAIVPQAREHGARGTAAWWNPQIFLEIIGGVCLIVFLGAGVQRLRLGGSGKSVAEAMGGRPLVGAAASLEEQKLRDVVDEMAIASGMPVPPIYILEEDAINAFAAGNNPRDAVLGFTRGSIHKLDRDELQGVAGHEFSHIAHHDTLLNLRLACAVAGVMLIALIGRGMFQLAGRTARMPRVSSGKDKGSGVLIFFAIALALLVIGGIGAFFGRLIQAAISRQREFLADAASVQYSRNPRGIASALRRIGAESFKPIQAPAASGLNHFFFSQSIYSWLSSHPPLAERIRRIEQGGYVAETAGVPADTAPAPAAAANPRAGAASGVAGLAAGRLVTRSDARDAALANGTPKKSFDAARTLLNQIPDAVRNSAREPLDAQAVLLLLVTGANPQNREKIRAVVLQQLGAQMAACWDRLASSVSDLPDDIRLIVLDLCVPTLTQLTREQYKAFRSALTAAIRSDGQVDLFEWMMQSILTRRIESRFGALPARPSTRSMGACAGQMQIVLGTLANAGGSEQAAAAFARGAAECGLANLPFPPSSACTLDALHQSLEGLDALAPRDRELLARALVTVASADDAYTTQEMLLLRAFSARLDVPLPIL